MFCDRCGAECDDQIILKGEHYRYIICADCFTEYKKFEKKALQEFRNFMNLPCVKEVR